MMIGEFPAASLRIIQFLFFLLCFGSTIIIANTYQAKYFASSGINSQTKADSNETKLYASGNGVFHLIDYINQLEKQQKWDTSKRVLTFRKSAASFYLNVPYVGHFDEKLISLYSIKNVEDALAKLIELDIGFILKPSYPQPEFYNSALQSIAGNPNYSNILHAYKGNTLYQIIEPKKKESKNSKVTLPVFEVKMEDIANTNENLQHVFFQDSENRRVNDFVTYDRETKALKITNKRGWLRNNNNLSRFSLGADLTGNIEVPKSLSFNADAGVYQFTSKINGRGYARVWLQENIDNRPKQLLWEGILTGDKKNIVSQFLLVPKIVPSSILPLKKSTYGLIFELIDGGELSVINLSIRKVIREHESGEAFSKGRPFSNAKLARDGWIIGLSPKDSELIPLELKEGQLTIAQYGSNPIVWKSPSVYVTPNWRELIQWNAPIKVGQSDQKLHYRLDLELKGRGLFQIKTLVECKDGTTEDTTLSKFVLHRDYSAYSREFTTQCEPHSWRLRFHLSKNDINEHTIPRRALVSMRNFSLSTYYLDGSSKKVLSEDKNIYNW